MSNSAQTSASSRIAALLDENSFVEVGAYITARSTDFNMTEQETPLTVWLPAAVPSAGCLVYVCSQDASVLGGSMGEMHAKKICNIYSMAMKMGAPVIGLVDCRSASSGGDRCPGRLRQAVLSQTMASSVIPQITAIFGTCGGGMAVSAGITISPSWKRSPANCLLIHLTPLTAIIKRSVIPPAQHFHSRESDWQTSQEMSLPLSLQIPHPGFHSSRPTTRMICHTRVPG